MDSSNQEVTHQQKSKVIIDFQAGTLIVTGGEQGLSLIKKQLQYDPRIKRHRAKAYHYGDIVRILHKNRVPYNDHAKGFSPLPLSMSAPMTPRPHQKKALQAWIDNQCRGVVVLPTGSGKSFLAMLAMDHVKRPAIVIVPTLDLMQQWASRLERFFNCKVGMLGGGSKEILDITVSTYDSAVLMMEFIGNRFGMIVFDECHHLPGPSNRLSASMCIAPYRLGLTATPERQDDGEEILYELSGPLCYRQEINELEHTVLSPYTTHRLEIGMDDDERERYTHYRTIYMNFVRSNNINFGGRYGWNNFLSLVVRAPGGREAFEAYLAQKRIAGNSRGKFRMIWKLISRHHDGRTLIFTAENRTAYEIGRRFFLPVLTHNTKVVERKEFLDNFRSGVYPVLVTSKVLNEGIDVPEASVGIVVSGSGSIREHVQRLGRILRPVNNKQANLYELVSKDTSEYSISERRRQHSAYQRPPQV